MRSLGLFVWITWFFISVVCDCGGFRLNNTIPLTHIVLSQNHAIA